MSKRATKVLTRRRARRILNKNPNFFSKVSGYFLARIGYGLGITRSDIRDNSED